MYVCTAVTPRRRLSYTDETDQNQQQDRDQPAVSRISRRDVATTLAHTARVIQQIAEIIATSRLR